MKKQLMIIGAAGTCKLCVDSYSFDGNYSFFQAANITRRVIHDTKEILNKAMNGRMATKIDVGIRNNESFATIGHDSTADTKQHQLLSGIPTEFQTVLPSEFRIVGRACQQAFGDDEYTKRHVRSGLAQLVRTLVHQTGSLEVILQQLRDASTFLKYHIVQAKFNPDTGNYTAQIRKEHIQIGKVTLGTYANTIEHETSVAAMSADTQTVEQAVSS